MELTYWAALDGSYLGGFTEENPQLPIHSIQVSFPPPIGIGNALQGDFRWDGEKWIIPIGGADLFRDYVEDLTQFDTNSTTFIDVLTHNYTAPFTGTYMFDLHIIWNSTLPNQSAGFRVLLDSVVFGDISMESNTSSISIRAPANLFSRVSLLAGIHEFKLQTKAASGGQTVSIFKKAMKFERWE